MFSFKKPDNYFLHHIQPKFGPLECLRVSLFMNEWHLGQIAQDSESGIKLCSFGMLSGVLS